MSKESSKATYALITGATDNFGYELAKLLARDKYNLVLVDEHTDRLEEIAQELKTLFDVAVKSIVSNLAKPTAPQDILREVEQERLSIEILINGAKRFTNKEFRELEAQEAQDMIQVNNTAAVQLTNLLLEHMLKRRSGRILNIASTDAFQPGPRMSIYYATKAFTLSFSESLNAELRGSGVSVTTLCPDPSDIKADGKPKQEVSSLFATLKHLSIEQIAQIGYHGLMHKQDLVVPGLRNKIVAFSSRFSPISTATRVAQRIQNRRQKNHEELSKEKPISQ